MRTIQYILFIQNIYKKTNSFTEAASLFFFIALFGFTVGALHSAETATQTLNCGKALTFPPILLFQLDKTSITLVNNRTISLIKHNFHRGSQRPSSGDAESRDPGLGTELQHRRDLTRWPLSHSIIQPISQAYNRARWKWRAGKACSRAPLQRSLWHCGCVGPSINTISGRISNNTRTSAVHLHHRVSHSDICSVLLLSWFRNQNWKPEDASAVIFSWSRKSWVLWNSFKL